MQSDMATTNLSDWSLTAAKLEGVNINRAPHDTNPASTSDWEIIFQQLAHVNTTITEIPRSGVSRNTSLVDELAFDLIDEDLQSRFSQANNFGYEVDYFSLYDNAIGENTHSWTVTEVQHVRDWMDSNGHENVGLMYIARNNSTANRNWCENPLVDHVVIEANANELLTNAHNQITLLKWLWTNPNTINKNIILQIPRSGNEMTQYAATRRVAVMLGQELGYEGGVQSDRLVFLPVTYFDSVAYIPETVSEGTSYTNSLTSLCLSLIEQRDLFEGRIGIPTNTDADSYSRTIMGWPVFLDLIGVDDFESYAVGMILNNQISPGLQGGLWDTDDEGDYHSSNAGKVVSDGDNQVVYQQYRHNGRRTLCVNSLADLIDEGETGALFFRFKALSTTSPISWYAGVHELTGSDPLTVSSADETGKLVAGFHAVSAGGSTFDIKSVDDSAILLTGLSQDQWYSVWMVVNHDLDTFDLFIEEAADGAGEVGLLTATAVGSGLPFEISTTNALTGGLWHQAGGNSSNMIFDEVAWSGNVPPQLPGTYGNDGLPWAISATAATRIEAENYNIGGEGVSYHDTTAENAGGAYRIEDVDIQATTDVGVGYNVSHIAADEWLEYSVDVAKRGIYELNLRTARLLDGNSSIRVLFDGQDKTGTLSVPSTDDWQTFTDTKKVVGLSAGRQIMRVEFLAGSQNLNWIELTYVGPNPDFLAPVGVGLEDFAHLAGYWLQSGCSMAGNDGCDGADLEDSGTVDIGDLQQLVNQWLENPLNTIQ